jgi:hypothetical protein
VISISIDEGAAERPKVVEWSKELKAVFPVLHDTDVSAADAFKLSGLPHNVVLDAAGKVVGTAGGDTEELDKLVAKVVKLPVRPTPQRAPSKK